MKTSDQINELAGAMAKAQAAMKPAIKDATNPAFRSKYADLTAVWESCRAPLTGNGITVWQDVQTEGQGVEVGAVSVLTRLVHTSGQWVEFGPLIVPLAKKDAHGVGSATSYAKRYALSAAVGIVSDDDDGNAAAGVNGHAQQVQTPAIPPGYAEWIVKFSEAGNKGIDALREAFKTASAEHRNYLTKYDGDRYNQIKRRAEKVPVPA